MNEGESIFFEIIKLIGEEDIHCVLENIEDCSEIDMKLLKTFLDDSKKEFIDDLSKIVESE